MHPVFLLVSKAVQLHIKKVLMGCCVIRRKISLMETSTTLGVDTHRIMNEIDLMHRITIALGDPNKNAKN